MRAKKMDVLASQLADFVGDHAFAAHRGVIECESRGGVAAFGNDDYARDRRARREVELIREGLTDMGLDILGFGLSAGDGCTWAMILDVEPGDCEAIGRVDDLVWSAWASAVAEHHGGDPAIDGVQRTIARGAISRVAGCFA